MDEPSALSPGMQLGKYRLERLLGRGGMGEVWAAHDPDLDRKVALKVLRAAMAATAADRARLLREGRAMARLRHPNVIAVYAAAFAAGRDLIAMELVDGESLAAWLARSHPRDAIVRTLLAAGRGLAAAHAAGMIHRDFKPHNVLVERDGRVLVTDFGLARAIAGATEDDAPDRSSAPEPTPAPNLASPPAAGPEAGASDETFTAIPPPAAALVETASGSLAGSGPRLADDREHDLAPEAGAARAPGRSAWDGDRAALHSPLTRTGALLGTPAYMAPEQLAGQPADARSDQFAFCVTAWEALAGARPFRGGTLHELADAIQRGVPAGGDRLPRRLRAILERGLAGDPQQRWGSMELLLRALERAWHRPRRIAIAATGLALVAIAIAVPVVIASRDRAEALGACPPVEQAFAAIDGPEARATLDRLRRAPPAARAVAFLDRWRAAWRATYRETCRRSGDRELLARRACLESLRDHLAGYVALAGSVPPELIGAGDLVALVVAPENCLDHPTAIAPAEPSDPAIRAELARIRRQALAYHVGTPRPPAEIRAGVDRLVADARATGFLPIVADALNTRGAALDPFDSAGSCAAYDEAANVAEQAGADLLRIRALFGLIECVGDTPQRRGELDGLLARARGLIDRIGDRALAAMHDLARAWVVGARGEWDAAIEAASAAHAVWLELDAPTFVARAALPIARFRALRHAGDDLAQAERILRQALDLVPRENTRRRRALRHALGRLLWDRGRFDEAIAILQELALPAPGGGQPVVVRVVDADGQPVGDAEVIAAVDPVGDPVRLVRVELRAAVSARTDAAGVATIAPPPGALILARKRYAAAAAPAPATGGELRLALGPVGRITGQVSIAPGAPGHSALGRRTAPSVQAATTIGGRLWSVMAPVDARGTFVLPVVLPGTYTIDAEVMSAEGDLQAGIARVTVAPDATTTVDLSVAPPVALRVVTRPAVPGAMLLVWPGHDPVGSARVARERLADRRTATAAVVGPPVIAAAGDAVVGDGVNLVAAPGPGPVTVCLIAGVTGIDSTPLDGFRAAPDAPPPRCATAVAADGAITTVVLPTSR